MSTKPRSAGPRSAHSATIDPARVRYIKLGEKGAWERECLDRGMIRIGFGTGHPDMFRLCKESDWTAVTAAFAAKGKDL